MRINWLKIVGIIVLDIFVVGLTKEIIFSEDINILKFIWESITYNFTHFSFSGLLGGMGMILLAIMFIAMLCSFLILNWQQLKSCFQKKPNDSNPS
ncbi:hypothetical protein [Leuconostoc mesenteroides]|uniref:hypothetical protein n=1 Tax=Leuconostoc mesenteroides TaxID=1245 RepID=UPI00112C0810|nr:hypothetical protein [Leuconostoc mesenteroides]TPF00612.1 hypothetical protein DIS10_08950 [Leuconostoc mesenteroides]